MTKSKGYDAHDIKAMLKRKGFNLRDISRALGYKHPDTARKVFTDNLYPVEQVISSILGIYPQDLWPNRYTSNGEPRYIIKPQSIARMPIRHVQNAKGCEHA